MKQEVQEVQDTPLYVPHRRIAISVCRKPELDVRLPAADIVSYVRSVQTSNQSQLDKVPADTDLHSTDHITSTTLPVFLRASM
jgi:hypothetical protein